MTCKNQQLLFSAREEGLSPISSYFFHYAVRQELKLSPLTHL